MNIDETREPVETMQMEAGAREPAPAESLATAPDPGTSPGQTGQQTKKRKRYTAEERAARREERIKQLAERLAKEKALKQNNIRKIRNSQLVAMGVALEQNYQRLKPEGRAKWRELVATLVTGHTLARVLAAFDRLDQEINKN